MKRIILIALILSLVFCVACTKTGNDEPDTDTPSNETTVIDEDRTNDENSEDLTETGENKDNTKVTEPDGYAVVLADGKTIVLGAAADEVIASLGEYSDMFEAPSCVHEGSDKVYTYQGFSVTSSPDENGDEYIAEAAIESADCKLGNGITIGSSIDDMAQAYGADYTDSFGFVTYELDGATASFVTDNGVITGITFTSTK